MTPPSTTKEQNSDVVSLRALNYEEQPMEWQRAVLWDCVQTRPPANEKAQPIQTCLPANEKAQPKLRRRKMSASHTGYVAVVDRKYNFWNIIKAWGVVVDVV